MPPEDGRHGGERPVKWVERWTREWMESGAAGAESGLTFLSEECVPVRSLGQTERGGCG